MKMDAFLKIFYCSRLFDNIFLASFDCKCMVGAFKAIDSKWLDCFMLTTSIKVWVWNFFAIFCAVGSRPEMTSLMAY